MVLSDLIRKLQTLPRDAEILLKDADGNFCDVDEIRGGKAFDSDYLVVLEGKPFIQIKGGKQRVVVTENVVEPAVTNIIQEAFDGFIHWTYSHSDLPKEGDDQYEQLRDAFYGGSTLVVRHSYDELAPELARYLEAKKMNIEFGGGKS